MKCIPSKKYFYDINLSVRELVIGVYQPHDCPCDLSDPSSMQRNFITLRIFRKGTDGSTFIQYLPYAFDSLRNMKFRLDFNLYNQPKGLYTAIVYYQDTPLKPEYTLRIGYRGYTNGAMTTVSRLVSTGQDENPAPIME